MMPRNYRKIILTATVYDFVSSALEVSKWVSMESKSTGGCGGLHNPTAIKTEKIG